MIASKAASFDVIIEAMRLDSSVKSPGTRLVSNTRKALHGYPVQRARRNAWRNPRFTLRWNDGVLALTDCHAVLTPYLLQSVQPDGRVDVPGPADFDHVELAGQSRRERWVHMALDDAPYRFIDFRHATGENEGH